MPYIIRDNIMFFKFRTQNEWNTVSDRSDIMINLYCNSADYDINLSFNIITDLVDLSNNDVFKNQLSTITKEQLEDKSTFGIIFGNIKNYLMTKNMAESINLTNPVFSIDHLNYIKELETNFSNIIRKHVVKIPRKRRKNKKE